MEAGLEVFRAPADQPRFESAGIFQNVRFEILNLHVQDDSFDAGADGLVARFGALLLDEGQYCLLPD